MLRPMVADLTKGIAKAFGVLSDGQICPAIWEKGKKAMQPTPPEVKKKYLKDFDVGL